MFNLIKKCELSINKLSRKIIYNFAEDKSKTTGENNEVKSKILIINIYS